MRKAATAGLVWMVLAGSFRGFAQEKPYLALRINEVIADNQTRGPVDIGGSTTDMVEIYNTSDTNVVLGGATPEESVGLSDSLLPDGGLDPEGDILPLWTFRKAVEILHESSIIAFCDGNSVQNLCEPHPSFKISSQGDEPISLWGPREADGTRVLIDQVWLPPLPPDVSFGRYPDGAGPAPVPLDQVLSTFHYNPPDTSPPTFGTCLSEPTGTCQGSKRVCVGATNNPGANRKPKVDLLEASTNSPAAGEPVQLIVRIEDDKEPLPGDITSAQLFYRLDGGSEATVNLVYDNLSGIQHAPLLDDQGSVIGENPFNIWTLWKGEIPGQAAGVRVEFYLRCRDAEGLEDASPGVLCAEGVGPCEKDFGGPGCQRDTTDVVVCTTTDGEGDEINVEFTGLRYVECSKRFTYVSGYEPSPILKNLVINEVVADQTNVLIDPSEVTKTCNPDNPTCKYDDFIEIHNNSGEEIDLSGLWLSNSRFHPRGWRFPTGSKILGGEYLLVWTDGDGGRCPCTSPLPPPPDGPLCGQPVADRPCFWECPDPTNPNSTTVPPLPPQFHTNFKLDAGHDQIYLYDIEERNFGLIHGVEFDSLETDHSLSLIPDGDRSGCWVMTHVPSVDAVHHSGAANTGTCPITEPIFVRGDANPDCNVDITDGIFVLNFLFTGGPAPECRDAADVDDNGELQITDAIFILNFLFLGGTAPSPPGPYPPGGEDVNEDKLPRCVAPSCQG